jgi:hypothetical protein
VTKFYTRAVSCQQKLENEKNCQNLLEMSPENCTIVSCTSTAEYPWFAPNKALSAEKRSNETHESKSDPEALLARKGAGKEAKLSYSRESAGGESQRLIVDSRVWEATGTAERDAALEMLQDIPGSELLMGKITICELEDGRKIPNRLEMAL